MTRTGSIWKKSLVAGACAVAGSWVFFSQTAAVSALLGVVIAIANFWLLERLVSGFASKQKVSPAKLLVIFLCKALVMFGAIGFVVMKLSIEAVPFLIGLSCLVIGITLDGLLGALKSRDTEIS